MVERTDLGGEVPRSPGDVLLAHLESEISGHLRAYGRELASRLGDQIDPEGYVEIVRELGGDIRVGMNRATGEPLSSDLTGLDFPRQLILVMASRRQLPQAFGEEFAGKVLELFRPEEE